MPVLVQDHGQVRLLTLPPHWQETEESLIKPRVHGPEARTFTIDTDSSVRLCSYFRGFPLGKDCGQAFHALLSLPPHTLNPEELESIDMVLREASEPEYFDLKVLRTEVLRGKTILVLEGFWKEHDKWDLGLYIDADGSGALVQELHYLAPPDSYGKHKSEVLAFLSTVEWR